MDRLNRDMKDSGINRLIARDLEEGRRAGINAVPTMFVNGKPIKPLNIQRLHQLIEDEIMRSES